jgi:hypothetical protein
MSVRMSACAERVLKAGTCASHSGTISRMCALTAGCQAYSHQPHSDPAIPPTGETHEQWRHHQLCARCGAGAVVCGYVA